VGTAPGIEGSSPQHEVLLQSSFDLPKRVTFDFDYRYVSALSGLGVASYSSADARLAWTFGHHWELSAVGRGLLAPEHMEYPGVGIKRSFYGKLVWTSKEN
jgi:iron complex outermembrane recepter protein